MKRIHFNLDSTVNYAGLQDQITSLVQEQLGDKAWSAAIQEQRSDCLNLTMFINEPGDVFLGHSVADRSYLWSRDKSGERPINRFSAVFVPGRWMKARLLRSPRIQLRPDQIFCVGSPRVDLLRNELLKNRPSKAVGARPKVLWAPTHNKGKPGKDKASVSTYPEFESYLPRLSDEFDVTALPHPRNREDKYAVVDELVSADIVISDISSVVYEAWAIGKPVIFPRWLLGDSVLAYSPNSAEAHIYRARIGYHPDDMDELMEIIRNRPAIGDDVHAFMDDYLDNYRGGNASRKVAQSLLWLADEDARTKSRIVADLVQRILSSANPAGAQQAIPNGGHPNLQLLQFQLLNDHHEEFARTQASMRQFLSLEAGLKREISCLAAEAAFMRSDITIVPDMIRQLRELDSPHADAYEARLLLVSGDIEAALLRTAEFVGATGQLQSAGSMLSECLERLHHEDQAWILLENSLIGKPDATELSRLALLVHDEEGYARFREAAHFCEMKFETLFRDPLFAVAKARAAAQAGLYGEARSIMSEIVLRLAENKKFLAQSRESLLEYDPYSALPDWLVPYESLMAKRIQPSSYRFRRAISEAFSTLQTKGISTFLTGRSLLAWEAGDDPFQDTGEIELGVVGESDFSDASRTLASDPHYRRLPSEDPVWCVHFKHVGGPVLTVRLYRTQEEHLVSRDGGLEWRIPGLDMIIANRAGISVQVPADAHLHLQALGLVSGADRLLATPPVIVDADHFLSRLYRQLLRALLDCNQDRVSHLNKTLKDQGEHGFDIAYAIEGKYLGEDLSQKMREARFLLHVGDGVNAGFHIDMWLDYCLTADPSLLVVIRSKQLFELLSRSHPELPAVYIKEGLQAEWLVASCTNLAGVLYVSNTGNTIHFLRFPHLNHIFLGHGDSEKSASCHKYFRAYDEVWTAGRAHIDRFHNSGMDFSALRFRIVGRPTMRPLLSVRHDTHDAGRFLYLPTWEGFQSEQNYSSAELGLDFIPEISRLSGVPVNIKFHPLTGSQSRSLASIEESMAARCALASVETRIFGKQEPVTGLMQDADFLISDISSVVTDFLCTGKPIFLFLPRNRELRMSTSQMSFEHYCYIFSDTQELLNLVNQVITGGDDYLHSGRNEALQYYIDVQRTEQHCFERELGNVILESGKTLPQSDVAVNRTVEDTPHHRGATLVAGHRGAKALWPENSLSGFRKVVHVAPDIVELDVHQSSDGRLVVIHDPTLDRTSDSSGAIGSLAFDEIKKARLKDCNEPIPSLDEALEILAPTGIQLHIEIKNDHLGCPYRGMPARVIEAVHKSGVSDRCTLTCFHPDVLDDVRRHDSGIPLLASINYKSAEMLGGIEKAIRRFTRIPGCMIAIEHSLIRFGIPDGLPPLQELGIWVVNDEKEMRHWFEQGVLLITTDRPDLALKMRGTMERPQ